MPARVRRRPECCLQNQVAALVKQRDRCAQGAEFLSLERVNLYADACGQNNKVILAYATGFGKQGRACGILCFPLMATAFKQTLMKKLRSANLQLLALMAAVIILAVAGLALLGAYFFASRPSTVTDPGWQSPLAATESQAIAPDLAVLTLAGEPEDRVVRAALDANEGETAYATLAYSILLSDQLRSGQWLLVARNALARQSDQGAIGYQAALDQSTLAPGLNDLARTDIALQAARGFAALKMQEAAGLAADQALMITRFSLTLLPAPRRAALLQIAAVYEFLGDAAAASATRQNLDTYSAGPGVEVPQGELLLPTLRGAVIMPAEVATALADRQQAAAALAARWLASGSSARNSLAQTLGETLLREDAARAAWLAAADSLAPPDRLALLHDRIAWLTIKYRASRQDYGVSLVAAWEAQSGQLGIELSDAYTELVNGYGQQLDTLDPVEALAARVELLRQVVLWSRLGLFPGDAEDRLRADLTDAARQLWSRQGGAGLTIVAHELAERRLYLLTAADTLPQ